MTAQLTYHASTLVVGEPGKRVRTPLDLIQELELAVRVLHTAFGLDERSAAA